MRVSERQQDAPARGECSDVTWRPASTGLLVRLSAAQRRTIGVVALWLWEEAPGHGSDVVEELEGGGGRGLRRWRRLR